MILFQLVLTPSLLSLPFHPLLTLWNLDEGGPKAIPAPMLHEGVLSPDLPDPASYTAPYEDEVDTTNQESISMKVKQLPIPPISSVFERMALSLPYS